MNASDSMRAHRVVPTIRLLSYIALVIACVLCIANAYVLGKLEDIDAKLVYGAGNDVYALTIAISEEKYSFREGYVGRPEVQDALNRFIQPPGEQEKWPWLAGDRDAIESGLNAATSLDPKTFIPYKTARHPFAIMPAEDTGLVDFYRLSFRLFGYHADAMYKTFFLLLTVASFLFLLQARHHLWAAAIVLAVLLGLNALLYLDVFVGRIDAPSFTSNRNLGTLGIISSVHLMLFIIMIRRHPSLVAWFIGLAQVAILVFITNVRTGAFWEWMAVIGWMGLILLLNFLIQLRKKKLPQALALTWQKQLGVIVTLVAIVGITHVHNKQRLERHNDIYFTECTMPHHLRWHSAYRALTMHPEWAEYAPPEVGDILDGSDGMGWRVGEHFWRRSNPGKSYICSRFPSYYLFGIHDKMMGRAYGKFARENPVYMLELYFIHKPIAIYQHLVPFMKKFYADWARHLMVLAGGCALVGWGAGVAGARTMPPLAISFAGLLSLLAASNLPHMFAYPAYMLETLWLLITTLIVAMAAGGAIIGNLIGRILRRFVFVLIPGN